MVRAALYLQDDTTLQESIKLVQYAETRGFEAVWQAENRLSRDAIVPMAAYAAMTNRIKIGAGVINNWTRNAALIASTFLTLDDLAPDRIMCGIGAWYDPLAQQVGVNRTKPLLAMRETVETVRALLSGQRINYRGEFVQMTDVALLPSPQPRSMPIYLGLGSPKMGALAGEIADGVLLNYLVSPTFNQDVMDELERGAKKAGRTLADIARPQLIMCSVNRNRIKALDDARRIVTVYIAQQPRIVKACGVKQELIDEISQVLTWNASPEEIADAMRLVPDDVVQLITASGTADEVREKVKDYLACGATCPVLYPVGDDPRYMIDVFSDRYLE
jgi:5,10-methylenetetrahydromethanopterin reductase